MIRHVTLRREDRVSDAVGCARAFGTPFVASGLFCLAGALGGAFGLAGESGLERVGVFVLGAAHLGGGLLLWLSRSSAAVVTRAGVEIVERRAFRTVGRRRVAPAEIRSVDVEQGRDTDGDAVYRPVLRTNAGERVALTTAYAPSRASAAAIAAALARRLERPDALDGA